MVKVTSKLQVTLPKGLADAYSIAPGDEIVWEAAGPVIRVIPQRAAKAGRSHAERLHSYDEATKRQQRRQHELAAAAHRERGWTREELHERGGEPTPRLLKPDCTSWVRDPY